jgi:serine acetyltransferase
VLDYFRLLLGTLPASRLKNALLRIAGWNIHPEATIGPCLMLRLEGVSLGAGSSIGPFNVFRNLRSLDMAEGSTIDSWNWASAATSISFCDNPLARTLSLGAHSAVTSRHYIDATGGVTIGAHATVAGHRTTILTHGIDLYAGTQRAAMVQVGAYSIVSSNTKMTPGSVVPDRCVIGMGSVVAKGLALPLMLYAGVPARPVKPLDPASRYFQKTTSVVP